MSNALIKKALLASTVIAGIGGFTSPAFAQPAEAQPDLVDSTAPAEDEGNIVVTGSRIARPNLEQSSPVAVVDDEEIGLQQPTSAEEFLRDLPGTAPGINPAVNNGTNGTASFNLRGLGTNRNLVLLNSRRVVPTSLGNVVDLNIIPVAMLERVDIFTGGASTAYGADAIAGVVNFLTRRDFAGIDISANYGITERGDGSNYRFDIVTGANFDDGRGNVTLGLSYTNVDTVLQGHRDVGTLARQSTFCTAFQNTIGCVGTATGTPPNQTVTGINNTTLGFPQGSNTAVPASLFFPLGPVGTPIGDNGGRFDPATGTIVAGLADYNFQPLNLFQTPLDRWSIFGQGSYEISDAVEVYTEAFFARSIVRQEIAPTGTFTNPFQLPLNNQFLTPAQRTQLCQLALTSPGAFTGPPPADCPSAIAAGREITVIIARRFVESGPRTATITSNVFQFVGGLRGPLTSTLDWDISGQYGESDRQSTATFTALADRVQAALRNCPAGSPGTGCAPINIFGAAGTMSQASLSYIAVPTSTFVNTEFAAAQAEIQGDLGVSSPLASEPIGVAVGVEYRRYGGGQFGDLPSATAGVVLGAGGAFVTVQGEYDSREAFAEINIPLVQDRPFFHNLTLEGGARYSDYSLSGGNWTYKVGGSWMPIADIKFRGTYARAVRAPNIGELFAPVNTVLNNLATDPCQGSVAAVTARGPNHVALCTAQLVAAGLPAATLGGVPAPIAGQINVTGGGNPNLAPEVARTLTAGVVLQPRFLPGFSATLDWYRIRVRGAVSAPSVNDVLNGCFLGTSPAFCALIFRNPLTGGLSGSPATTRGVFLAASNLGFLETEGFDFTANYRRDLGFARLNWSFNGNHTRKSRFQATPASILRECVNYYSVSCDPPLPEWSWNMRTTLTIAETDISVLWRHISATEVEPIAPVPQVPVGTPTTAGPANIVLAYRNIPAYNWFDLALQHSITEALTLTFVVQNLLDKDPPEVGQTVGSTGFNSGGTIPSVYDTVGRRFLVSGRLRF